MELKGSVPVFPTEDPEKVLLGIINLFPESEVITTEGRMDFSGESADMLVILLEDQKIRDTALMILRRGLDDDSTRFHLNKQAAFVGKVNFTDGRSLLGDIEVRIVSGALDLMRSITPE